MSIAPRRLTLLVSLALGSMVVTSRASAAEPDPAQAGTQSNAGAKSSEITEVIVTAQKVQQPISKVPMSISAVTQAALEKQGVGSIADLSRIVPGLTVRQDSEPNVSIRGLASSVGAATTAIYIDDTPIQMHNVLAATASAFPAFSISTAWKYCAGRRAPCSVPVPKAAPCASSRRHRA